MPTLLPFAPEHFATLASWFATERDLKQWGGTSLLYPMGEPQLARMLDEGSSDPPLRLCWMAREDGDIVGHAQLQFDWRNANATLQRVGIAPRARGRGLARPMLAPVIDKAFGFRDIERVELSVYSFNKPGIRTYASLGFKTEGIRRASAKVGSERWDTVIMGVLRPEWMGGRRAAAA